MKNQSYSHLIKWIFIFFLLLTINTYSQGNSSNLIDKYSSVADRIINYALKDSTSFEKLAYMCDAFGNRLSGSDSLNKAILWLEQEMIRSKLENVRLEEVMVPHWVRGKEYCNLIEPYKRELRMLSLGGSIKTPREGITAPVLVVKDLEDLEKHKNEAKGKIVLFNYDYKNYGQAVQYRFHGAEYAGRYGAVASLIRSATPFGMNNPHTGSMGYNDSIPKIPHAALTVEDAALLDRIQKRGQTPVVTLYMESDTLPDKLSYNVVGELVGSEIPNEIIVIGGHSDSWDVGSGAHDDASGCIGTIEAVRILKELGLRPKRTIRVVAWVNEENGMRGAYAYANMHKNDNHVLAFEWDSGVFPPSELRVSPDSVLSKLKIFEPLFKRIDSVQIIKGGFGVDIIPLTKAGVPTMSLNTEDHGQYMWYHHSPSDTPDKINPLDFNKCIATIALIIYIYADL